MTKLVSAELSVKPLASSFNRRLRFGRRRRILLVQLALAFKNPDFLVELLDLCLIGVGGRRLFRLALLLQGLDFLIQFLNLLFQGFNLRRFRGIGGGVISGPGRKNELVPRRRRRVSTGSVSCYLFPGFVPVLISGFLTGPNALCVDLVEPRPHTVAALLCFTHFAPRY